jgi:hypothetical protein
VLQVGTWKGLSASHLAGYLKLRRSGVLLCVDTWLGALEFWKSDNDDETHDLHLHHGWPSVYYTWGAGASSSIAKRCL